MANVYGFIYLYRKAARTRWRQVKKGLLASKRPSRCSAEANRRAPPLSNPNPYFSSSSSDFPSRCSFPFLFRPHDCYRFVEGAICAAGRCGGAGARGDDRRRDRLRQSLCRSHPGGGSFLSPFSSGVILIWNYTYLLLSNYAYLLLSSSHEFVILRGWVLATLLARSSRTSS